MATLRNKIKERMAAGIPFCSIEIFPPSLQDCDTALNRIRRLNEVCYPLFTAVACLKQPDLNSFVENLSLYNKDTYSLLLHLPASGLTKAQALKFLNDAKDNGVNSIFALRGDIKKDNSTQADFAHAVDLVTFIRKHFGSYFTICVAGYPERHPESESDEQDLLFLKEKVEAGADFIITQMFFKCETFIKYEQQCRYIGITVPIIPGIMPIKSYESLQQVTKRCYVEVPKEILKALEPIRDDKEKVQDFGTHLAAQMVDKLLPISNAVHFFTLNSIVLDECYYHFSYTWDKGINT